MKLSAKGTLFIANSEGFSSTPYLDSVGVWTIGYGSTKGVGPHTRPITRSQALARLKREVDATYGAAVNALGLKLNQNQFDALVSFVYNVGPGGIGRDTGVGRALRARQFRLAADRMLEWNKGRVNGRTVVIEGLTARRKRERALFLAPVPVRYRADERSWIRSYKRPKNKAQKLRARVRLTARARSIRKNARKERNGWNNYDRSRRYQGIARTLGWKK